MYAGIPVTRYSGRVMGAHQKIDRVARRHLAELLPQSTPFPAIKSILHFEGKNGPDGIKVKSPAKDEPWHFFDPLSTDTDDFMQLLGIHYKGLVQQLKANNYERAAFEAAWLAHAIVDGLTPAHHYPFEQKISELRGGADNSTRTSYKKKLFFSGDTTRQTFKNMYKAYGPRGIYLAHILFEFGFTAVVKPLRCTDARPTAETISSITKQGYEKYFLDSAKSIAEMRLFDEYLLHGWTSRLARKVKKQLAPTIIQTVTLLWYQAARESGIKT